MKPPPFSLGYPPSPAGRRALERVRGFLAAVALPMVAELERTRPDTAFALEAELVVDAPGMAATRRNPAAGAIFHSDRESQYASTVLGRTLTESGLAQSMGRRGCAPRARP